MGLERHRVPHIREVLRFLGNSSSALIEQLGEVMRRLRVPFQVVPEFRYLADFWIRDTPEQRVCNIAQRPTCRPSEKLIGSVNTSPFLGTYQQIDTEIALDE
jgi:hypothetical protein